MKAELKAELPEEKGLSFDDNGDLTLTLQNEQVVIIAEKKDFLSIALALIEQMPEATFKKLMKALP